MLKSKKFRFSIGAALGAIIVLFSLKLVPCNNNGSTIFSGGKTVLPCPVSPLPLPLKKSTKKVSLMLMIPQSIAVHVGDLFPVTLELNATTTPVNTIDVTIAYPTSSVRLIAKDESVSPLAIRLVNLPPDDLSETTQIQPSPGIQSVATLAKFTFQALRSGTAAITIASSSQVLANDGFGTDVLGSVQDALIIIK
jgi:hypothetical protein